MTQIIPNYRVAWANVKLKMENAKSRCRSATRRLLSRDVEQLRRRHDGNRRVEESVLVASYDADGKRIPAVQRERNRPCLGTTAFKPLPPARSRRRGIRARGGGEKR